MYRSNYHHQLTFLYMYYANNLCKVKHGTQHTYYYKISTILFACVLKHDLYICIHLYISIIIHSICSSITTWIRGQVITTVSLSLNNIYHVLRSNSHMCVQQYTSFILMSCIHICIHKINYQIWTHLTL